VTALRQLPYDMVLRNCAQPGVPRTARAPDSMRGDVLQVRHEHAASGNRQLREHSGLFHRARTAATARSGAPAYGKAFEPTRLGPVPDRFLNVAVSSSVKHKPNILDQ